MYIFRLTTLVPGNMAQALKRSLVVIKKTVLARKEKTCEGKYTIVSQKGICGHCDSQFIASQSQEHRSCSIVGCLTLYTGCPVHDTPSHTGLSTCYKGKALDNNGKCSLARQREVPACMISSGRMDGRSLTPLGPKHGARGQAHHASTCPKQHNLTFHLDG